MPFENENRPDYDGAFVKGRRYITFTDVPEYRYVNVIKKVMGIERPMKSHTLRPKYQELGVRYIRDGKYGTNTDLMVEIVKVEHARFIDLTEEFAKADLATDTPPVGKSYKRDLYGVLKTFYPRFFPSFLHVIHLKPVAQVRQVTLDGEVKRRGV